MVNSQLRTCDVTNLALLAAFLEVPREDYVPESLGTLAFLDQDVPALGASRRKLLAPRTLARLLQAANVQAGHKALDVAGGSGYSAAILSHLGAKVVALESDAGAAAAARSRLKARPGTEVVEGALDKGIDSRGPYDVIVVNGAFQVTPKALLSQLAEQGRLVGVDARGNGSVAVMIERIPGGYSERSLFDASADVLDEFRRAAAFAF